MKSKVTKAIFPVAGLGTRFLPATKSIPKEILTLVDRPLIQYAIDEARAAGIEEFIFVTSRGKSALEDYFDNAPELESALAQKGKTEILDELQQTNMDSGAIAYVRQNQPLGLGHAVWCARRLVHDEAFVVDRLVQHLRDRRHEGDEDKGEQRQNQQESLASCARLGAVQRLFERLAIRRGQHLRLSVCGRIGHVTVTPCPVGWAGLWRPASCSCSPGLWAGAVRPDYCASQALKRSFSSASISTQNSKLLTRAFSRFLAAVGMWGAISVLPSE